MKINRITHSVLISFSLIAVTMALSSCKIGSGPKPGSGGGSNGASGKACGPKALPSSALVEMGLSTANNAGQLAQSIVPASELNVLTVSLLLKKYGSLTQGAILTLETDDAGSPSGTVVASAATSEVSPATLSSGSASLVIFKFSSSITLSSGTRYWIRLRNLYATSGQNYFGWTGDANEIYTDGFAVQEVAPSVFRPIGIGTGLDLSFSLTCQ